MIDRPNVVRDVVVVGAGPAGLYTALRLAQDGRDVLVLEEHGTIGVPTHCTGVVSAETENLYKTPNEAVLHRPTVCDLVGPVGTAVTFRTPGEEILVLDRAAFDQSLATSVLRAGGDVATGAEVVDIMIGEREVRITTAAGETVRSRAVVLACGVTYRFHRRLGSDLPSDVLHCAQAECDAAPLEGVQIHVGRSVAPGGFGWLVPVDRAGRSRVKAGLILQGDARAHLERFLASPRVVARITGEPEEQPVRRLLPVGVVARSHGLRWVAVGDAAGLTKPVTGGGIFYSLLSGDYAAQVLQDALAADDLRPQRLATYERAWRQRLMPEIRIGRLFRRLLVSLSDTELEAFVRAVAADDVQAVIGRTAKFNWHRSLIRALLRQPGVKSILLRSLFR